MHGDGAVVGDTQAQQGGSKVSVESTLDAEKASGLGSLPDVQEAELDNEGLRSLLADIATYGQVLEVSIKASPRGKPTTVQRLPELYLKLIERRIFGAQLRYVFEGQTWLDTLIATRDSMRLVRIEVPA